VRERERWVQRQSELGEDEEQARLEQERCGVARGEIETEGAQLQAEMVALEAQVSEVARELEGMRTRSSEEDRRFDELNKKHQAALVASRQAGEAQHGLQVKMAGVLAHAEEARLRLEEHGNPEEPARKLEPAEFEKAKSKAVRLRNFLENFGSVNLGAREDHERLVARNEELTTQVTDLEDGAASLKKIMAELDQVTVAQFKEAFHRVNETFAKMFTELFCGGTARLELVTPDDYLESGVEVVACPPGKRLQSLTLLSSGERALSAMAFLLALLSCKPSPVVILDELDAPLDDANVERVAKRLMQFSSSSQFLVITHNRKTMEFADRLYGVTMEEPGSSRILSVRLTSDGEVEAHQSSEGVAANV
jgi:chromosome segregation protein